jgi:hypothetical protein
MLSSLIKLTAMLASGAVVATELPSLLQGLNAGGQVVITANDMQLIKDVVFTYQSDSGRYPNQREFSELLRAKIGSRENPDQDRWGSPFQLEGLPKTPYILSCGPDKECGTSDDLKVYVGAIPEGETQANVSDLVQANLLDKFHLNLGEAH